MAERFLFVTGKLAAPALRATLGRAELPFGYDVAVMKITVAALMTTEWIARRLEVPDGVTAIMIPGLCQGDPTCWRAVRASRSRRAPPTSSGCRAGSGRPTRRARYGPRDVRVFAEINNVPRLGRDAHRRAGRLYRDAGADVIDLGLSLDRAGSTRARRDRRAQARGFTLSIDTLDPEEILMADAAGVDYVLSLNGDNRDLAERLRATPVLIPDTPTTSTASTRPSPTCDGLGKPYLVDPIIEPIGSGFAASLGRYLEVRRRHPEVEMLMGIGNLTELTEADTTGVTALLHRVLPGARASATC